MYIKSLVATVLAVVAAAQAPAQSQLQQYEADVRSYVNSLSTQTAVIAAFAAIQSANPAAFSSLVNEPAKALEGATTGGTPAFYTELPSSALAVIKSINSVNLSLYQKDITIATATTTTNSASATVSAASQSTGAAATAGAARYAGAAGAVVGIAAVML